MKRLLVGLLVAGVTVACGPAEGDAPTVSLPPVATSAVPSQTSAQPSLPPSPSSTPTPSASPSPTSVPSPPAPAATRTADPKASAPSAKAVCEIVSNAGNCYNAGQFCRKADLGRSTHAGNGRLIHCRLDGTQPRWQY